MFLPHHKLYLLAFPEKLNLTACKYSDCEVKLTTVRLAVPTSNLYAQLNGLQLSVDPASVLWISLFSRGLLHTLDQVKAFYHLQDSSKADEHVDIRMDAAQLKVNMQIFDYLIFSLVLHFYKQKSAALCDCLLFFSEVDNPLGFVHSGPSGASTVPLCYCTPDGAQQHPSLPSRLQS